jgi:hypothetical protein
VNQQHRLSCLNVLGLLSVLRADPHVYVVTGAWTADPSFVRAVQAATALPRRDIFEAGDRGMWGKFLDECDEEPRSLLHVAERLLKLDADGTTAQLLRKLFRELPLLRRIVDAQDQAELRRIGEEVEAAATAHDPEEVAQFFMIGIGEDPARGLELLEQQRRRRAAGMSMNDTQGEAATVERFWIGRHIVARLARVLQPNPGCVRSFDADRPNPGPPVASGDDEAFQHERANAVKGSPDSGRDLMERLAIAELLTTGPNVTAIAKKIRVKRTTLLGWPTFRTCLARTKQDAEGRKQERRGRRAGTHDFEGEGDE